MMEDDSLRILALTLSIRIARSFAGMTGEVMNTFLIESTPAMSLCDGYHNFLFPAIFISLLSTRVLFINPRMYK